MFCSQGFLLPILSLLLLLVLHPHRTKLFDQTDMSDIQPANDALDFNLSDDADDAGPQDEALVDEGQHDTPFDVAEVPRQLAMGDPHAQVNIHLALYPTQGPADDEYVHLFNIHRMKHISLRALRHLHDNQRAMSAITLLSKRHQLRLDNEDRVDVMANPNLVPRLAPHYLDYTLYVGSRHGLDAALPNVDIDHNWTAKLQLSMANRFWPDNAINSLPFDPKGRMMYIGTRLDDQMWIAMVPNKFFDLQDPENTREKLPVLTHKHPVVEPKHARTMVMFIAHVLADMRFEDIHCIRPYPEPLTWDTIRDSTEILGHFGQGNRTINLRLTDLWCLHQGFLNHWHPWVAAAPQSWKVDGFLTQNAPVSITLRYGQNQPLLLGRNADLERHNWDRDRKYAHICQVSFSLATHISYLNVNGWSAIDRALIQRANPVIYDKPDDDPTREQVDLADLPLVDEDGFEINVYNPDGFCIPRQKPTGFETCGALLDLKKVHELFQGTEDAHGHVQNEVPFTVYPLAFTRDLGNVKVTGLMPTFACRVMQLNAAIHEDDRAARHNVDDDDPMIPNRHSPALLGISSQIYNSLSHRVHTEAKFHVVQLGMVTSAFAGASAKSATGKCHWERQVKFCEQGMPHVRFSQKVSGDGQPQTLRFENTYILDISRMRPDLRTGSMIYDWVICPLLKMWSHPSILAPIKDVLVAFQPNIIPELFKCVTYPITALIDLIWGKHVEDLKAGKMLDPCMIEFVSMLEHMLNYTHTGNAAVLCKKLMDRAWLSLGLIQDGWPVELATHRPLTSSKRCQELTYGQDHYKIYEARFAVRLAVDNVPDHAYVNVTDPPLRVACYIANIALKVYFDNVKQLVYNKVMECLNPTMDANDPVLKRTTRNRYMALSRWMDEARLLSYTPGILSNLLHAVAVPDAGNFQLTPSVLGQKPVSFLAESILTAITLATGHCKPPFISGGNFYHVVCVTVEEMKSIARRAGVKCQDEKRLLVDAFCHVFESLKVNHVPWPGNPQRTIGRPSTATIHDIWLNLGAKGPASSITSTTFSQNHSVGLLALRASEDIQASDARGDWSALDIRLLTFDSILHKVNMPTEWKLSYLSAEQAPPYVTDAYHFVRNKYDGLKPLHQLATLCAVVCTGLIPSIFPPEKISYPSRKVQYEAYIRDLDWVTRKNRKGTTAAEPFITMVIGFIISLYKPDSPISHQIRDGSDLKLWWAKHTKWNIDIHPLPSSMIREKHAEVVRLLKTGGRYGGFDAVRYLIGTKAADILNEKHYVYAHTLPPSLLQQPSSSKRGHDEVDDGEEALCTSTQGSSDLRRVSCRLDY
ncbi:hypothetical protein EDC04DRAFT_2610529 [Pisolithus marmoratus]|nr:hypothetical protein EDC04DRAFT_2610529 [Pisolithus marmoratus]